MVKVVGIVLMLLVGAHLLLYGYLQRHINAAKHQKDEQNEG